MVEKIVDADNEVVSSEFNLFIITINILNHTLYYKIIYIEDGKIESILVVLS